MGRFFFLVTFVFFAVFCAAALPSARNIGTETEVALSRCWSYPTNRVAQSIWSDESGVLVGTADARIESVSPDGKRAWISDLGGELASNLLTLDGSVLVATISNNAASSSASGTLLALSRATGITTWTAKLPPAERYYLATYSGSVVVVSSGGAILSLAPGRPHPTWSREIAQRFEGAPAFVGSKVLVAGGANQIFVVSLLSGEIEMMRRSPFRLTAVGETEAGELVIGDDRGNLSILNGSDKPVWRFKSGGQISEIVTLGQRIFITSHDNFLYAISSRNGDVVWKRRLSGRAVRLWTVKDRYVMAASLDDSVPMMFDLTTGRLLSQIQLGEGESIIDSPLRSNGAIVLLTNRGLYSYSVDGCGGQKNGGSATRVSAHLK